MSTTTAPAVKAQLLIQVRARPALAAVQVEPVWPGDATKQQAIWFGDVRGRRDYVVMRAGRKPRDEQYTVDVFCQALRPDKWSEAAETDAIALMAEIEDLVAADPAIGLSATLPTLVVGAGSFTVTNGVLGDAGWGCLIRLELEVRARLS